MVDSTGSARFSNQEIMLSIPAETIAKLGLEKEEQILVTLLPMGTDGFSLDIKRNGELVTDLGQMQITLPYTPKDASSRLVLFDDMDNEVTTGTLSETRGLVTFSLNKTGVFSIEEEISATQLAPAESDEKQPALPILIVVFLVLTAIVVLFILYRKRGR